MTLAEMRTLWIEKGWKLYLREMARLEWLFYRELFARGVPFEERSKLSEPWTGYRLASESRSDYGRHRGRRLPPKL